MVVRNDNSRGEDVDDHLGRRELEAKRVELAIKMFNSAIERQVKLATFGLAGNIGAHRAGNLAMSTL